MSASLNKVQLIGHLGKDPEIRRVLAPRDALPSISRWTWRRRLSATACTSRRDGWVPVVAQRPIGRPRRRLRRLLGIEAGLPL